MGSREYARGPRARKSRTSAALSAAIGLESALTTAIACADIVDDRDLCDRLLALKRDAVARRTLRERGEHAEPPALFIPYLLN
jgi:hypothetical protein